MGDPFLMLGPSETATYELVYSPLRPGETTGAIIFSNEEVGEFWYQLELTSQPSAVTSLPEMICEVGTSQEERFEIDNPIGKEVTLGVSNSNPRNFVLSPSVVTLPPYGTLTLTVTYNPSSLNEVTNVVCPFFFLRFLVFPPPRKFLHPGSAPFSCLSDFYFVSLTSCTA